MADLGFSIHKSISFTSVFNGRSENCCTFGLRVSVSIKATPHKRDVKGLSSPGQVLTDEPKALSSSPGTHGVGAEKRFSEVVL